MNLVQQLEAGKIEPEKKEALRASIRRGDCPFCGKSGYKHILLHVSKAHDLTNREARELLGFTFTEAVCSPEFSEQMREARLSEFAASGKFEFDDYRDRRKSARNFSTEALRKLLKNGEQRRSVRTAYSERKAKKRGPLIHGIAVTYTYYGCRCAECRKANTEKCKKFRGNR